MTLSVDELSSRLALAEGGLRIVEPCLELVVVADGPLDDVLAGYERIRAAFVARYGHLLRLCAGYDDAHMRAYDPADGADLARWLLADAARPGWHSSGVHFQAGEPERSAAPPMFDAVYLAPRPELARSGLRIAVPLTELRAGPDGFAAWCAGLLDELPFAYAFGGLAFAWNARFRDVAGHYKSWAVPRLLRYPGLSHGDLAPFVVHAQAGLLAVNWLTAVGAASLARLGGAEALVRTLPHACEVVPLRGGAVLVRAGSEPAIGDVNREESLPLYQAVAVALRALWCADEYLSRVNLMYFDAETGTRWLRRFLG